jgi:hypothetical protein
MELLFRVAEHGLKILKGAAKFLGNFDVLDYSIVYFKFEAANR